MTNVLFVVTLLLSASQVVSMEGCLSLSPSNTCLICDTSNGFYISNGVCVRNADERCTMTDQYGRCMKCKQGFYLNTANNYCSEFKAGIANCQDYLSPQSCGTCAEGFEIHDGECAQIVGNRIDNCLVQAGGKCQQCKANFMLGLSKDYCYENPRIQNCAFYGSVKCDRCNNGFITNPNFYLQNIFGF